MCGFGRLVMHEVLEMVRLWGRIAGVGLGALVSLTAVSWAQAGTATSNLSVQIVIQASCTINAATLDFGASVPGTTLVASNVDAATTVSVVRDAAGATYGSPVDSRVVVRWYWVMLDLLWVHWGSQRGRMGVTGE